jgi:serine/threonine protein kinase
VICYSCGAQLEDHALACSRCGLPTEKDEEVSAVEGVAVDSLLRTGQRVADRYLIKRSLGMGRLGVTYHATDLDTGREVALKMIYRHLLFSKRDRKRFQAWMETARGFASERIAAPLRSGRDERFGSFVITDLIDAPSLAELQRASGRSAGLGEAARLVDQLRQALEGLQGSAPHGGLHPGNILVLPDRLVLTDLQTNRAILPQLWAKAQQQGLGGASWLAPEVVQGREDLDGRADVFSVASIVEWMLSGQTPGSAAFDRVRDRWPAVAGVLSAARSDLASERLFEITPLIAALSEQARSEPLSGESIALADEDLLETELPEEVTEVTSSAEFSIREEDLLEMESIELVSRPPIALPTPAVATPERAARAEKETDAPAPAPTPAATPATTPAAALRQQPAARRVTARRSSLPPERNSGLPKFLLLFLLGGGVAVATFALAKAFLPRPVPMPANSAQPSSLRLAAHKPTRADAGYLKRAAKKYRRKAVTAVPVPVAVEDAGAEEPRIEKRIADVSFDSGLSSQSADAGQAKPASPISQEASAAAKINSVSDRPNDEPTDAVRVSRQGGDDALPATQAEPAPAIVAARAPAPKALPKGRASCRKGMGLVRGKHTVYCVDRYEYPNTLRRAPQGNFNAYQAQAMCAKKGKRICTTKEWTTACSGRAGQSFPYGSSFVAGRCNTVEDEMDKAVAPFEYKKCRSPFRIYAMAGNLAEWTKDGSGFTLKGGSYASGGSASRCSSEKRSSARAAEPEFGVRCCSNPTYE